MIDAQPEIVSDRRNRIGADGTGYQYAGEPLFNK
jgi:hypothetical protein